MTISYVISGTKPNLTIQATDPYGTIVTISYNTGSSLQYAFNTIRQAFIDKYNETSSMMTFTIDNCSMDGTKYTCQATDTHNNTITTSYDITHPSDICRNIIVGAFIDYYGMSNQEELYSTILMY